MFKTKMVEISTKIQEKISANSKSKAKQQRLKAEIQAQAELLKNRGMLIRFFTWPGFNQRLQASLAKFQRASRAEVDQSQIDQMKIWLRNARRYFISNQVEELKKRQIPLPIEDMIVLEEAEDEDIFDAKFIRKLIPYLEDPLFSKRQVLVNAKASRYLDHDFDSKSVYRRVIRTNGFTTIHRQFDNRLIWQNV